MTPSHLPRCLRTVPDGHRVHRGSARERACENDRRMTASKRPRRVDHRAASARRPQPPVARRSPIQGRYAPPQAERLTRYRRRGSRPAPLPGAARAILLVAVIALAGAFALVVTGAIGSAVAGLGGSIGGLLGGPDRLPDAGRHRRIAAPEAAPRLEAPGRPLHEQRRLGPARPAAERGRRLRGPDAARLRRRRAGRRGAGAADDRLPGHRHPPRRGRERDQRRHRRPGRRGATLGAHRRHPRHRGSRPRDQRTQGRFARQGVGPDRDASRARPSRAPTSPSATATRAARRARTAKADGTFEIKVGIADGTNTLTVTATDQAGNETTKTVSILRGSGKLTARVGVSPGRVKASRLPEPFTVRATVADVGGKRVPGATVIFSLSPPGQPTSTYTTETNDNGVATWRVTVPTSGDGQGRGPGHGRGHAPGRAHGLRLERLRDLLSVGAGQRRRGATSKSSDRLEVTGRARADGAPPSRAGSRPRGPAPGAGRHRRCRACRRRRAGSGRRSSSSSRIANRPSTGTPPAGACHSAGTASSPWRGV